MLNNMLKHNRVIPAFLIFSDKMLEEFYSILCLTIIRTQKENGEGGGNLIALDITMEDHKVDLINI